MTLKVSTEFSGDPGIRRPSRDSIWVGQSARFACVALLCFQAVLLFVAGWRNRHMLNPDAISYIRLASYYARGQTDLMVSGYWSPFLSWLMVPCLLLGAQPLAAARVAMGFSALVFSIGCIVIFRRFGMSPRGQAIGTSLAAGASLYWSVYAITPDLLATGLLCLAIGQMVSVAWATQPIRASLAGLFWGLAYLAKAVALPLGVLLVLGFAVLWWMKRPVARDDVLRALVTTTLVSILVALPWATILSLKYHAVTFSTTARIAHAVVGPPDLDRDAFLMGFRQPEAGRITSAEDFSILPYRFWTPWSSWGYFRHQVLVIARNLRTTLQHFGDFDFLRIGLLAGLCGLIVGLTDRRTFLQSPWCWTVLPLVCMAAVYAPVYVTGAEQRYFYLAYPCLIIAAWGAAEWLSRRLGIWGTGFKRILQVLILGSFAVRVLTSLPQALGGIPNPAAVIAFDLAERLNAAEAAGAIAGSGWVNGGPVGLYAAFLLNQPWFGDERNPTAQSILTSGARVFVVKRRCPLADELNRSPGFTNLDSDLFRTSKEADAYPLKVFRVVPG